MIRFLLYAFLIIQQPAGQYGYVSQSPDVVTQFSMVSGGNVGLLAHAELAGSAFDDLQAGDVIRLADGEVVRYEVNTVERYYALDPYNPYSNFKNVDTGEFYTANDLFMRVYGVQDNRLVLQTCFDGVNGRLFVIAYPETRNDAMQRK